MRIRVLPTLGLGLWAGVCLLTTAVGAFAAADAGAPRELFQQAWQQTSGTPARGVLDSIADYPLAPYLEARLLSPRRAAADDPEVMAFLERHAGSVIATDVRRQWLAAMARSDAWHAYLQHYREEDATTKHQCWRLQALLETGAEAQLLAETSALWMRADSLPSACDPAFRFWLSSGQRTQPMIWQRLLLALQHDEQRLARYLISQLQGERKTQGRHLLALHRHPQGLERQLSELHQGPHAGAVLSHTLKRLAKHDYREADRIWVRLTSSERLEGQAAFDTRRAIARQVIAAEGGDALPWLLQRDPDAEDDYLLQWRVRLALRQQQWRDVEHWIALLPEPVQTEPRWRYWQARALLAEAEPETPRQRRGEALLETLAKERNFYGFLAADRLQRGYQFAETSIQFAETSIKAAATPQTVAEHPAVRRAQEWLALGQRYRARREWNQAMAAMDLEQRRAAAVLADTWQWHGQAIRTAILGDAWDDLRIRFPLAYQNAVQEHARDSAIAPQWLFAVIRQESAFIPDARSPAGARGLLQLMPGTARDLASQLDRPYQLHALDNADYSLALGSHYLAQLLNEFEGNRILATAAYNAGPHRIGRVLAQQQSEMPADIWIETLPYYETRSYIQNVLSFAVIYAYRMGQHESLLSAAEYDVKPAASALVMASAPD